MWPDHRPAFAAVLRGARRWALWLALALAAAHSIGAWHVYTHPVSPAGERGAKSHAAGEACAICVAIAAIGGAPPAPAHSNIAPAAPQAPAPVRPTPRPQLAAAGPYAARAPPTLAS
jgi:hypothetical protein